MLPKIKFQELVGLCFFHWGTNAEKNRVQEVLGNLFLAAIAPPLKQFFFKQQSHTKSLKGLGSWQHLGPLQFWHQRPGTVFYSLIEDQEED